MIRTDGTRTIANAKCPLDAYKPESVKRITLASNRATRAHIEYLREKYPNATIEIRPRRAA